MRIKILFVIIFSFNYSIYSYFLEVRNQYNKPVSGAEIRLVSESNAQKEYTVYTNQQGFVEVDIPLDIVINNETGIEVAYPNPFSEHVMTGFVIEEGSEAVINVHNIAGQTVYSKNLGWLKPNAYFELWKGIDNHGNEVPDGMYLIEIRTGRRNDSRLVYKSKDLGAQNPGVYQPENGDDLINYEQFKVEIQAEGYENTQLMSYDFYGKENHLFGLNHMFHTPFKTNNNYFLKWNGLDYDSIFIKGINLGVAVPNTLPGELAATKAQYDRWLEMIASFGFNSIRIYTLHYPRFYQALYEYNITHPEQPLLLFQGVWLDEKETDEYDLFEQTNAFEAEIERVIHCTHGNNFVLEGSDRYGKASGNYQYDISPWVISYLIGHEISPFTILYTNNIHSEVSDYKGQYVSLPEGNPSENWLCQRIDKVFQIEGETYDVQRPVGFSNWPTLDPLRHYTERLNPDGSSEDTVGIDLGNIELEASRAGTYVSYHAYSYFPDYINEDSVYVTYSDDEGPNSYLGYLHHLKEYYDKKPLLIAEFGVSTSWGNAHDSYSGMTHGAMTEADQGHYALRMLKNMQSANCAGGLLFSWIDEWFKNAWITMEFDSDLERKPLWNNKLNPEQNFGLISFEEDFTEVYTAKTPDECVFEALSVSKNNEFLSLDFSLKTPLAGTDTFFIAFDTYREDLGESVISPGISIDKRAEFLLKVIDNTATYYVTEAYDLFAIWYCCSSGPEQMFRSVVSDGAPWKVFRIKNNWREEAVQYVGKLRVNQDNTLNSIDISDQQLKVRIPWGMLQFKDPSLMEVMNDDRNTRGRESTTSDGIALTVVYNGCTFVTPRIKWKTWQSVEVTERLKKSVSIIQEGIDEIGF